jgi:hypothetical protein
MKIKNGKVFYKLIIEKNENTKKEFLEFARTKTTDGAIINDIDAIDFNQSQVKSVHLPEVQIDLNIKPTEISLLFHTTMLTMEFDSYTTKWFT